MTDAFDARNSALEAGLVGSCDANRRRESTLLQDPSPRSRRMVELGFPADFWLTLKAAESWRTDDYPAQRTVEAIRAWLVLSDQHLNPKPDIGNIGFVDMNSQRRAAHRQDAQLVRQHARNVWDEAVDCSEVRDLPAVRMAAGERKDTGKPNRPKKRSQPSMKLAEANRRVASKLKQKKGKITLRELSEQITDESDFNCSTGLISDTTAWKTFQEKKKKSRSPSSPRTVSLSEKLLATHGSRDEALGALIQDQEEDHEPSPLDPAPTTQKRRNRVL